jgi:hypothetical protein
MKNVLLIGVKLVKAESVIENNVDDKLLQKTINTVQETQLKPILGKGVYETVCGYTNDKITNTAFQIPEPYKELVEDYIQPYLVNATTAEFIAVSAMKVSNKGLQKLNDNSSTSVSVADLEAYKNIYDNHTTTYKQALINFLQSSNLLPLNGDTNTTSTGIGWFLESKPKHCYNPTSSNTPVVEFESDPVWNSQKGNYYTKFEIDALLAASGFARNIFNEFPSGAKDGVNIHFTTAFPFIPNTTQLYLNGQRLINNYDYDYYELGNQQVVFRSYSPKVSDKLVIDYLTNSNI